MASALRKGIFTVVAGLAFVAGTATAQQPAPVSNDAPDPYLQPPPGKTGWLTTYFQRHNCCCASHHNDLGCTSGMADCKFIFGSCRTFWSEPCPQGPSPYKYVPPQSTKPPSKISELLHHRCASCEHSAP
jgi:hypothetical protein